MHGSVSYPRMGNYRPRMQRGTLTLARGETGQLSLRAFSISPSQSAISPWGWGFHTVHGGIDPGYHCSVP